MRIPLEIYVVIDKDGDLNSMRAFANKQEAEFCAGAYDVNYPSIAPHEVVRLIEAPMP